MTPAEILAMPPGPELDNALAPLLGYTVERFDHELDGYTKRCTVWKTPDGESVNPIPLSIAWEGMRLVTEAMAARGWNLSLEVRPSSVIASFHCKSACRRTKADTAPEAVAKAALLAMEAS